MRAVVLRGDAGHLPFPDESVDLIMTSPPFYKLRAYMDGGEQYDGQLGAEDDPRDYVAALLRCTAEWKRVLKPTGSLFVELGDSYTSYARNRGPSRSLSKTADSGRNNETRAGIPFGFQAKSRMLLPQRYIIGCLDQLGLIVRQEIIWHHVNETPESVTDRARTSHSVMYHMVKQPRYYSAVDEVRVPHAESSIRRVQPGQAAFLPIPGSAYQDQPQQTMRLDQALHSLGRLPGSIWAIPSAPLVVPEWLGVRHYAAFPPALCKRVILGWSPREVCLECGQGRFPVSDSKRIIGSACACTPFTDYPERRRPSVTSALPESNRYIDDQRMDESTGKGHQAWPERLPVREYDLDGWTPAPVEPGVVVDPFGGSGTTALVASVFGRAAFSVDMSADYCRLAAWRTRDPGERARAMGVPKPPPVPEGQGELFDLL